MRTAKTTIGGYNCTVDIYDVGVDVTVTDVWNNLNKSQRFNLEFQAAAMVQNGQL